MPLALQSAPLDMTIHAVALYPTRRMPPHELASHAAVARQLAALHGVPFAGLYDPGAETAGRVYYVPTGTLIADPELDALAVSDPAHLFGGHVPHRFVATKAITHPLIHPDAQAPQGWSNAFTARVAHATLPGWTAFCEADAHAAFKELSARGPVRVKPVNATAGRGQSVVTDATALASALAAIDARELAECGVVLELHLEDVITFSVGQVVVDGLIASYVGTQCLTPANDGEMVYGGSSLNVVRGDFEALLNIELDPHERTAIEQARCYDEAAHACFPGFYASRRNYDMVTGLDAAGQPLSGVLEQSWRIGGASGAELAALVAFRKNPSLHRILATTGERYGVAAECPANATIVYQGDDSECGPMIKYVVVENV
ncbi:DUF3182 family protein [Alcaligenaceae bacterium A4P071]|nr:DUF3182 family protein [Alcaligenaceae bacterium A4P071]